MRPVVVALAFSIGCTPPAKTPLAPIRLTVRGSPASIVQAATRELVAAGYDVTLSDAGAGTVVAARKASPEALGEAVFCNGASGSMLQRLAETTHRITLTARADTANTSSVQLTGRTVTSHAKMIGIFAMSPDNETDCRSSGVVESKILAALKD
jgi:hypothetical protein